MGKNPPDIIFELFSRTRLHLLADSMNRNWLYLAVIVLVAVLLHSGGLDGHWRWDDPQILRQVLEQGAFASFVEPGAYIQYQRGQLTPWLVLSFQLDWWLFGPEPFGFYLHQLFAIALAAVLVFAVGRQWMGPELSFVAAMLFLAGSPLAYISEQLMTRHYIEGLVFALISLYLFTRCLDRPSIGRWTVSVICYLLAVTCKEVYAPLLLLLPFIPRGSVSARLRLLPPFVAVAVLYVFWRMYMLDNLIGGYEGAFAVDLPRFALAVATAFLNIPRLLFPAFYPISILLCLAVVLSGVIIGRANVLRLLFIAGFMLAPLAPLVIVPGLVAPDRYFLVPWTGLSFLIPFLVVKSIAGISDSTPAKSTAIKIVSGSLVVGLMSIALYESRQHLAQRIVPAAAQWDAHARFLLGHDSGVAYIPGPHVLASFWFVTRMNDILPHLKRRAELPAAVLDPIMLADTVRPVYVYAGDCRCMEEASGEMLARYLAQMENVREEPLQIELSWHRASREDEPSPFRWKLGPWREGEYRLISSSVGNLLLPPEGSLPATLREMQTSFAAPFILKYTSPEGWVAYSPELSLDITPDSNRALLIE